MEGSNEIKWRNSPVMCSIDPRTVEWEPNLKTRPRCIGFNMYGAEVLADDALHQIKTQA